MEKLKELVELVTRNKLKSIEIISDQTNTSSKLGQFYHHLKKGTISSDEEAIEVLYDDSDKAKNAYYKLKHTLKQRLFNMLYFTNLRKKNYSETRKTKLSLQKLINTHNILHNKGAYLNAVELAEKGVKQALFYEFTYEAFYLSRRLRTYYSSSIESKDKFDYYNQTTQQQQQILSAESRAEGYVYELMSLYVKDKSTKHFVSNVANNYLIGLHEIIPPETTCNYYYYVAFLKVIKYMSINDYITAASICKTALAWLKSYRFLNNKWILMLSLQYISCCIQIRDYQEGEATIMYCQNLFLEGTFNWFKIKELHLTLCTHTKNYNKAAVIFEEASSNKHFSRLPTSANETWKIYEAWLYFLKESGNIVSESGKGNKETKFRINKYLNEVPIFSKDKRGLNISILISQVMLLFLQRKYDIILDKIEAIAKYKDRYVKKEENFRSNMFIRMLLEVPKGYFKRNLVEKRSEKYKILLRSVSIDMARQSHELEIVPYEDAWEMLLGQLKQS